MTKGETIERLQKLVEEVKKLPENVDITNADTQSFYIHLSKVLDLYQIFSVENVEPDVGVSNVHFKAERNEVGYCALAH